MLGLGLKIEKVVLTLKKELRFEGVVLWLGSEEVEIS